MFESAELGHKIKKTVYEKEVPALREALLDVQMEMAKAAKFAVIVLVGGLDGAGRLDQCGGDGRGAAPGAGAR